MSATEMTNVVNASQSGKQPEVEISSMGRLSLPARVSFWSRRSSGTRNILMSAITRALVQIAEFPSGTVLFWGSGYGDE